jgi:outer membrane protein TolC
VAERASGLPGWALLPLILVGCATYVGRPLETADPVARYQARRLIDPAVSAALDSMGIRPAPEGWRDWELAAAAWVMGSSRARMLAEIGAAEAGRVSAGARPAPGLATDAEYSFSGAGSEPRFGLALGTLFGLETGGKRAARLARANAGVLSAVARAVEEAWEIRWRVRLAFADRDLADRRLQVARTEAALTDSVLGWMRARYEEGAVGRTEVARLEADRQERAAEVAAWERERERALAGLAAAVGVPVAELERTPLVADASPRCAVGGGRDSLEQAALNSRRELYRVLADYQVAEGDVRLEVARSWPDLAVGPGLFFDHGINKWTIAFGLPSLPFNRNRGPIGEAEARREVAARRVAEAQDQVIGEVEQAIAGCAAVAAEVAALDVSGARAQADLAARAYERGEIGKLELAFARLEQARAVRRVTEAEGRLLVAGLEFERAIGTWSGVSVLPRPEKGEL